MTMPSCRHGFPFPCGEEARAALVKRIGRRKVVCVERAWDGRYGRPVSDCSIAWSRGRLSLNRWMVANGLALAYDDLRGWLVSVGFTGYFTQPMDIARRVAFVVAGIALMLPRNAVEWGVWSDIAGLVLGAVIIGWEIIRTRRSRAA